MYHLLPSNPKNRTLSKKGSNYQIQVVDAMSVCVSNISVRVWCLKDGSVLASVGVLAVTTAAKNSTPDL